MFGGQQKNWNKRIFREPSIAIKSEWTTLEEYSKPHFEIVPALNPGVLENGAEVGKIYPYLKQIDKAKPNAAIVLKDYEGVDWTSFSTIDDTIMRRIAKEGKADIFATDQVIATLMACQQSVYSWDILVQKFKDKVFLDVREDPNILQLLTVNETTADKSPNDDNTIDGAREMMQQARKVNDQFVALGVNQRGEALDLAEEDHFKEVDD